MKIRWEVVLVVVSVLLTLIFLLSLFLGRNLLVGNKNIATKNEANVALSQNIYSKCDKFNEKDKRFACYKEVSLYAIENGKSILGLMELTNSSKSPHLLEHSIGRAILITANYDLKKVRVKCASSCSPAYYHGIAEEWAVYAPKRLNEFKDFLLTYCSLDNPKTEWCHHNIGHFYLAVNKSLDKSLALCDALDADNNFLECSYGVIHEQLIQFGITNLFNMCSKYDGRVKSACYTISSRLFPQWLSDTIKMDDPLKICNDSYGQIPEKLNHCYRSIAWVIGQKNVSPNLEWCQSVRDEYRNLCVSGLKNPESFWDIFGCSIGGEDEGVNTCSQ